MNSAPVPNSSFRSSACTLYPQLFAGCIPSLCLPRQSLYSRTTSSAMGGFPWCLNPCPIRLPLLLVNVPLCSFHRGFCGQLLIHYQFFNFQNSSVPHNSNTSVFSLLFFSHCRWFTDIHYCASNVTLWEISSWNWGICSILVVLILPVLVYFICLPWSVFQGLLYFRGSKYSLSFSTYLSLILMLSLPLSFFLLLLIASAFLQFTFNQYIAVIRLFIPFNISCNSSSLGVIYWLLLSKLIRVCMKPKGRTPSWEIETIADNRLKLTHNSLRDVSSNEISLRTCRDHQPPSQDRGFPFEE